MNDDRASRAWRASKNRKSTRKRPVLSTEEKIEFLGLVGQLASRTMFERKLSLTPGDVEFYKRELDVETPEEARRLARRLQQGDGTSREERAMNEPKKAREAEAVAQARLDELEAKKRAQEAEQPRRRVDLDEIRKQDAARQRILEQQENTLKAPKQEWQLPIEVGGGSKAEQIDRFRRDIIYHGMHFVQKKHNATPAQIKYEAARLGLKIDWDIVRR